MELKDLDLKRFITNDGFLDEEAFGSYVVSEGLSPSEAAELETKILDSVEAKALKADEDDDYGIPVGWQTWYKEVKRIPLLTVEQEKELGAIIKFSTDPEKVREARNELADHNIRFVVSVAGKFAHKATGSYGFEDMVQDGSVGLMKAAEKFDVEKGFRFTTYAKQWIRSYIQRGVQLMAHRVSVPSGLAEKFGKLVNVSHVLSQQMGRDVSMDEIAAEFNRKFVKKGKDRPLGASQVAEIFTLMADGKQVSLEQNVGDGDDTTVGDFIAATGTGDAPFDIEEEIDKGVIFEALREVIASDLSPVEQKVIDARFGLTDGAKQKLEVLGRRLGVTGSRIGQIEQGAVQKLTAGLIRRGLDPEHLPL